MGFGFGGFVLFFFCSGLRALSFGVLGCGFGVLGFWVPGFRFRVLGAGFSEQGYQ